MRGLKTQRRITLNTGVTQLLTAVLVSLTELKMGCGASTETVVQPLTADEWSGEKVQDETETKVCGRGDSAVSKVTSDSGVVMENREFPSLPGAVPIKLPPLSSGTVREIDAVEDGLQQQDSLSQERLKSSEILEELLNDGIITVGQASMKVSGSGEAYSITLNDGEEVKQRPPARLESLRAKKTQSVHNKEDIDEKMKQVEERRKSREDELKSRLRSKSARVRRSAPVSTTEEDEDTTLTLVEPLPLTPERMSSPPLHQQAKREAAEGGESLRESEGDDSKLQPEVVGAAKGGGDGGEWAERGGGEEELTQVEEFDAGEQESDSTFQHAENKEEVF